MLGPTPAVHPGEILRMEFLVPLNLSAYPSPSSARYRALESSGWPAKRSP
jgi:hypothetical protein